MKHEIDDELLQSLGDHLTRYTGWYFPKERRSDLIRGVAAIAQDEDFKQVDDCAQWLLSAPLSREQIQSLAKRLTVGETYFFRDPPLYETLRLHVLPPIIEARRDGARYIRIWSAGCSTGEEAYSLAILLQQVLPEAETWDMSILATDINTQVLEKAEAGRFGQWSFRNPPAWLRDNYFHKTANGQYEINAKIRRGVTFSYLNLAAEQYPMLSGTVDIILCRNVLMYLASSATGKIIQNFSRMLAERGWLIVTPAEASLVTDESLSQTSFSGQMLYRKLSIRLVSRSAIEPQPSGKVELKVVREKAQPKPRKEVSPRETTQISRHDLVLDLANKGELALALEHCEQAIETDRLNPGWHYLLATILQEQGQLEKAVAALHRAVYLDQDFVMAHFALGNLYRQQGRHKLAARHLQSTLQLLRGCGHDDVLPESSGMTAGRLKDMIQGFMNSMEAIA